MLLKFARTQLRNSIVKSSGGSITPIPLATRIALEGDSYSTNAAGYAFLWPQANPSVPFKNFSVTGSSISSLRQRLDTVIADQPSILTALVGANDLAGAVSAEAYAEDLLSYFSEAKAKRPGLITVASEVMPVGAGRDTTGKHNQYRPIVNSILRAAVGQGRIDAIVPFGTHPEMTDAAGSDPSYYNADQIHPTGLTFDIMFRVYSAVINPIIAKSTATSPTNPSFTAEANRDPLTSYTSSQYYTTGMAIGSRINASVSGAGTSSVGQSPFSTTTKQVINGDVIRLRQTSSSADNTTVKTQLTLGTATGEYAVTTKAAAAAAISAVAGDRFLSPAGFSTTKSFTMPLPAGRPVMAVAVDGQTTFAQASLTIDGKACTKHANAGAYWIFVGPEPVTAGNHALVFSSTGGAANTIEVLPVGLTNATAAQVGGDSILARSYRADGLHTAAPALTIGTGGLGVIFYFNAAAKDASTFTKADDQTLLKSFGEYWHVLTTTTSGSPSFTAKAYANDLAVAIAINP